jgi:hypothetical protein
MKLVHFRPRGVMVPSIKEAPAAMLSGPTASQPPVHPTSLGVDR